MTSLFRPWTEEKTIKSAAEMTDLFEQSSGLWLPKDLEKVEEVEALAASPAEDSSTRESRYKSVKEHMKKRSEKYLLKKLKVHSERKTVTSLEEKPYQVPSPLPLEYAKTAEIGSVHSVAFPASCCAPIDGYLNPFECLPNKNVIGGPSLGLPMNSELLETALNQGFPPNLFEEYARFLTEQQRHVAERNRKQRPKKFRCPHCHVGFSNNGQLKGHIRIHTGERPFKCDAESCGKSFTRNEELTRHRRIHSGLRPFPCSECGKRFGRKDHLKKHIKTHFQQRYQLVPILPSHCPYFYGL